MDGCEKAAREDLSKNYDNDSLIVLVFVCGLNRHGALAVFTNSKLIPAGVRTHSAIVCHSLVQWLEQTLWSGRPTRSA